MSLSYMSGFGNHFATEAVKGALPEGQNSPQSVAFGLYAEQFSTTAFTAPRTDNRRTWFYRLRPSAMHGAYQPYLANPLWGGAELAATPLSPNRLRWQPLGPLEGEVDFVDGLRSLMSGGDVSIALYGANVSMRSRSLMNADAEMLFIPQKGGLRLISEMGILEIAPKQIAVIPRGIHVRVELLEAQAFGYVCENAGSVFRLPDLGPIGANGLANPRDFETPVAAYEDEDPKGGFERIQKFQGHLWSVRSEHSPFDVVAWHGNSAPYRYDLGRFNTMNTVSFDHADPSIFTVLTSPSGTPGVANCDFVIFPPRWMVAEHSFRPPWFHRNLMSEFMGLIEGQYDAKADGFLPGGGSLHNQMSAHGPDCATYQKAIAAELKPERYENTLAFMLESVHVFRPSHWAMETHGLQSGYDRCWDGFPKAKLP